MRVSLKTVLTQSLALCSIAAGLALLTGLLHPKAPRWQPPAMDQDSLAPGEVLLTTVLAWEMDVIWVDARSKLEYNEWHFPGAVRLTEDEWEALFFDFIHVWEPDRPVVVYCEGELCLASDRVAARLREALASDNIYVLRGGWSEWPG